MADYWTAMNEKCLVVTSLEFLPADWEFTRTNVRSDEQPLDLNGKWLIHQTDAVKVWALRALARVLKK